MTYQPACILDSAAPLLQELADKIIATVGPPQGSGPGQAGTWVALYICLKAAFAGCFPVGLARQCLGESFTDSVSLAARGQLVSCTSGRAMSTAAGPTINHVGGRDHIRPCCGRPACLPHHVSHSALSKGNLNAACCAMLCCGPPACLQAGGAGTKVLQAQVVRPQRPQRALTTIWAQPHRGAVQRAHLGRHGRAVTSNGSCCSSLELCSQPLQHSSTCCTAQTMTAPSSAQHSAAAVVATVLMLWHGSSRCAA